MSDTMPDHRFSEGDVITLRGHEYEVKRVDVVPTDDHIIQYRLEGRAESPPATLKPHTDDEDAYTVVEYHEVDGGDITVIE